LARAFDKSIRFISIPRTLFHGFERQRKSDVAVNTACTLQFSMPRSKLWHSLVAKQE
jgi:hypothetical protein